VATRRLETWLTVGVLGIGLLLAAIGGLWSYMKATATPLHATADGIPSALEAAPVPHWAAAVEEGQQIIRAGITDQNLPGVSVAVGIRGQVVWSEGFGWADLERLLPVKHDTRFRIGTASTALTSAGVGWLLEHDRLQLDDTIQTYVPEFPAKAWPVTVRQLMGHVAGIRPDAGDEEPVTRPCDRTSQALARFADRPLLFEPGTRYRYSSYGWILVSAAIEAAAGEPFYTFMQRQVFDALGLDHTSSDSRGRPNVNRAVYYFPRFAADPRYGPQSTSEVDYSCFAGASAFLSTAADLVRFVMAIDAGTLLTPETVQLLRTPLVLPSGEDTGYGLGWDLETVTLGGDAVTAISQDGTLRGGGVSSFLDFPDRGLTVAVIANTSYADAATLALAVAEVFAKAQIGTALGGGPEGR